MIQRIQTLYLIGAAITTGLLPFFMPLWIDSNNFPQYFSSFLSISVLFGFSTALSVLSIFSYKKRQQQFVVGRLNILLNLILLGLFVFGSTVKGQTNWYKFGGFGFQPSEFVKTATGLLLAKYLSYSQINLKITKHKQF